jgi:Zn-finger protein
MLMIELAKKHLKKVLRICGANRNCQYYPCHFDGQVCLWCYCPFYPCEDEELGEMIKRKDGTEIWSCMNCVWVHKPDVACEILREILELTKNKEIDEAVEMLDNEEIIMKIKENVEKKVGKNNNLE